MHNTAPSEGRKRGNRYRNRVIYGECELPRPSLRHWFRIGWEVETCAAESNWPQMHMIDMCKRAIASSLSLSPSQCADRTGIPPPGHVSACFGRAVVAIGRVDSGSLATCGSVAPGEQHADGGERKGALRLGFGSYSESRPSMVVAARRSGWTVGYEHKLKAEITSQSGDRT